MRSRSLDEIHDWPALLALPRTPGERGTCAAPASDAPVVLAFSSEWFLEDERASELDAIRAELRGLGAVLVVVSPQGLWFFRPDDDVERFASDGAVVEAEVVRLAKQYGVRRSRAGELEEAVFVLDGTGRVRLAIRSPAPSASMRSTLAIALGEAGRQLVGRRPPPPATLSRREWVLAMLVAGFAVACGGERAPSRSPAPALDGLATPPPSSADTEIDVVLHVNGVARPLRIEPRVSLLDALRERLGLTGSKKGCDHGQCGACTVLVDGRRVCACLILAVMVEDARITTIEGLANGEELHPVQAAFIAQDGFQCGYCTPGQIMSAVGLLAEGHAHTDDEVREEMSGNLCRCGAYPNIVAAVQLARKGA